MPQRTSSRSEPKSPGGREYDREWHDYSTPADPRYAELCAMSLTMWTAGADPREIAEWLDTQRHTCPVSLDSQIAAVRGLAPYHRSSPIEPVIEHLAPPVEPLPDPDPSLTQLDRDLGPPACNPAVAAPDLDLWGAVA